MKNPVFKRLVITAIICAVALSACKQESDPQKKIIVTGIPETHDGRFAVIRLIDTDYPIAENENRAPVAISNRTVTIGLIALYADGYAPFTDSGIFKVLFNITDSTGETDYYSGVIDSKPLTDETTTIRFSEFRNASP